MENLICLIYNEQKTVIRDSLFRDAVFEVLSKNKIYHLTRSGYVKVTAKQSTNYNARKYRSATVRLANWCLVFDNAKNMYFLLNDTGLIGKKRIIAMTNNTVTHYHSDIACNYHLVLHRDTLRYTVLRDGKVAYSVARKSLARVIEEIEDLARFDNALHFFAQLNAEDKRKFINTLISVDYNIKDI